MGNTHIWVLRAQCWLWGGQAGEEETEKQSSLSPKVHVPISQSEQLRGKQVFRVGTQDPPKSQHLQLACGLPGNIPWPAWASSKPKACNLSRPRPENLAPSLPARPPTPRLSAQELEEGRSFGQLQHFPNLHHMRHTGSPGRRPLPYAGQTGVDTHCQ